MNGVLGQYGAQLDTFLCPVLVPRLGDLCCLRLLTWLLQVLLSSMNPKVQIRAEGLGKQSDFCSEQQS